MNSLRPYLLQLLLLWAVPAFAQTPTGAWTGKLGRTKIAACFDEGAAAYYYVKIGVDIPLARDESGAWKEKAEQGPSTGTWRLSETEGDTLAGTWTSPDGKRTLPIRLQPAPTPANADDAGAADVPNCRSAAYNAPRLAAMPRTPGKQETKGWLTVRSFSVINPDITGLEIVGNSAQLAPLKRTVERLNRTVIGGYFDCIAFARESGSANPEYGGGFVLETVTEHFVVVQQSVGYWCGGAHPDGYTKYFVLERKGAKPVDLEDWLREPLDDIGRKFWKNDQKGCGDALMEDTTFVVRPAADGMVFEPRLPHAIDACASPITVSYAKLAGKLTAAGKRATAEFAAAVK